MKKFLLIIPFLFFLAACNHKRQAKAEELVKNYLHEKLIYPESYHDRGFSDVVKLEDKLFPGATAPMRFNGRWEIVHTYECKNDVGKVVVETKVFEINPEFTEAYCCYARMSTLR